jgi:hypothetical protein
MRVICIEDSVIVDKNRLDFGGIAAHKGSVYTVIGSVDAIDLRRKTGINYACGPWYEFLELSGLHHHVRFVELEEDTELEIEKTLLIETNLNCK